MVLQMSYNGSDFRDKNFLNDEAADRLLGIQLQGFFRRRPISKRFHRGQDFEPCKYENLNAKLFLPVIAGMWKQHELWDGTYTFNDWLDAVEMIEVKNENQARQIESIEESR